MGKRATTAITATYIIFYDCAAEFMEVLDEETAVEYVDDVYHKVTTHGGRVLRLLLRHERHP